MKEELEKVYEIKTSMVGRRQGLEKEVRVLNRIMRWTHEGWEYEADQRHGEIIVRETGTEEAKEVTTPTAEEKEEPLSLCVVPHEAEHWTVLSGHLAGPHAVVRPIFAPPSFTHLGGAEST